MGIVKSKSKKETEPETHQRAIGIDPENMPEGIEVEDLSPWLYEAKWPLPNWYGIGETRVKKLDKNYDEYVRNNLKWRYTRLEGDFRTVFNNYYNTDFIDKVTARRIISFLESARQALESNNSDPSDISNLLDLVDQYMVWLYPPHVANSQAIALATQLKGANNPWGAYLEAEITRSGQTLGGLRAALDKVKQIQNEEAQTTQLNNGLQIERLEMLIKWGLAGIAVLLIILPLIMKTETALFKESFLSNSKIEGFKEWLGLATIGVIGATGAFLSGLLQIRRTKVSMAEFKESVIQFKLRPIIGAIFAIFITTLITWEVISGVEIKNAGAYMLIAFLCGFSERYFLSLLKIDEEGNSTEQAQATTPTVAASGSQAPPVVDAEGEPVSVNDIKIQEEEK